MNRQPAEPNFFDSTLAESRLLCVWCRRRLGVAARCVEYEQAVMGRSRKPNVAHRECHAEYLRAAGMLKPSPETSDELDAVKRDRDFWRAQVMDEDGPLMEENSVLRLLLKEGRDLSLSNQRAASMRHRLVEWGDRVEVALRTNYERE